MKPGFVLGEVWQGTRSNFAMVFSIILVTFISFSFFGVAALLQLQVEKMTDYWSDRAQVSVVLCNEFSSELQCPAGAVSEEQIRVIGEALGSQALAPYLQDIQFENQEQAYEKFLAEFGDSSVVDFITKEQLTESYLVRLEDPSQSELVIEAVAGLNGVQEVIDQRVYLDGIFALLDGASIVSASVAGVLLLSSALLVSTTIRLSAYSRRKEIEIMQLVGASNPSIQLPFVIEGILAGGIGAALAAGALLFAVDYFVTEELALSLSFTTLVGAEEAMAVVPYLVAGGVILSAFASAIAIRRYLRN